MKIVTYNVNGLRPRVSQFGSLVKLLHSLDADIICFQETKLSRQELKADLVRADGYESFFSCTRTNDKGRTGYSGVATFCRVKSAFSSDEVALPLAAEEGFTGLLDGFRGFCARKDESLTVADGLEDFTKDDLLKVDSEGRCVITDHGHFVLFNVYGPRADCDDTERIQFKLTFFNILQRRWESLLHRGRRIFVVGDLNIAPATIDRCDAGPDFEKNEFRRWFRSLLTENGGPFIDVFRAKHPQRREAYTCWPTSTGAEVFNFGTRIDHILSAGSCLHQEPNPEVHDFITCHVKECDILTQFKRCFPGNTPSVCGENDVKLEPLIRRWKGGRSIKLEGSDHAPVYMSLEDIPSIQQHNTPPLSMRYCPQVHGCQQTLVSMLMRRQSSKQVETNGEPSSELDRSIVLCDQSIQRLFHGCTASGLSSDETFASLDLRGDISRTDGCSQSSSNGAFSKKDIDDGSNHSKSVCVIERKKKARHSQWSQLSLKSFFQKSFNTRDDPDSSGTDSILKEVDASSSDNCFNCEESNSTPEELESNPSMCTQDQDGSDACHSSGKEKRDFALLEWQRIQQLMQSSIPVCKGHGEPCVVRVVKKAGPTFGRRFYVCARAEGPQSNPEANCGYFKWAASKFKRKAQ